MRASLSLINFTLHNVKFTIHSGVIGIRDTLFEIIAMHYCIIIRSLPVNNEVAIR